MISINNVPQFSDFDRQMMERALLLAKKGRFSTPPNPAVGCVICRDEQILSEGWHQKAGQPHAERIALTSAQEQNVSVEGATVYVTLEPCSHTGKTPPCANALIEAKVGRVVIAMEDPNPLVAGSGVERIQQAGIQVDVGLLEAEAEQLNQGFIHSMVHQMPFVRLKMAASLDGRTAMKNGDSQWITGEAARLNVHKMRARHGALITGIGTVLTDDPSMNVRLPDTVLTDLNLNAENCHPVRVVLDAHLSMPLNAKMLTLPGRTILMTSKQSIEDNQGLVQQFLDKGVELVAVSADGDKLDLKSVLKYLHEEEQVREVMVEAGAVIAGAFIKAQLLNELHVYMAPSLLGDTARPMFSLSHILSMSDKIPLQFLTCEMVGEDVHMVLTPQASD